MPDVLIPESHVPSPLSSDAPLCPPVSYFTPWCLPAFIIPCSMGHAEVAALYAQGAKEAFESTELRLIPGKEIVAEGGEAWFAARRLQASPSFLGALELWRAHRFRSST